MVNPSRLQPRSSSSTCADTDSDRLKPATNLKFRRSIAGGSDCTSKLQPIRAPTSRIQASVYAIFGFSRSSRGLTSTITNPSPVKSK